jgi:hypothetical protein
VWGGGNTVPVTTHYAHNVMRNIPPDHAPAPHMQNPYCPYCDTIATATAVQVRADQPEDEGVTMPGIIYFQEYHLKKLSQGVEG